MVTEVRQEINYSKYLKISQSILDKCINALGVYTEEDLQIRKEILNSISEIWAIFNETLPENFSEIFPPSVSSIIILVKLCTLIFNNTERDVDAGNKLEACKLLDKHIDLLDASHRERSVNLSIELKTQTLIAGLIINEDINEIIEQIFVFNDTFNDKNSLRIEEIYIQNDLITLRKKFPFELFEIDFISYIIYFINNYSEIFPDQKKEQLGKIEWNHNATDEIKYRLKFGHPRKELNKENEEDKEKDKDNTSDDKEPSSEKIQNETSTEAPKKRRMRKRKNNDNEEGKTTKTKTKSKRSKATKEEIETETSKSVETSTSTNISNEEVKQELKREGDASDEVSTPEVVKQKRHTKKRWNETQEKFLEECIRENNFVIDPKKFYEEHGPNGTKSHNLGEFTVNNIRDKCKSEKRKRIKMNMNLGVYEDSINNSFHIQMEIKNELVNNKRVPNCRRRRWTEEQLKCLEKCILESNGNIYPSLILNLHGPNGVQSNILGNQTRQSIHDKCKNEKWKRIQQGLPLGAFEKAAKKSISSIGNKWRNTKVLKDYVASSEGKRRKRNVDPYYKPDHQKQSRKRKSNGESTEESDNINDSTANNSNVTSQSQENGESSSTFDPHYNLNNPSFSFNNNESSSSFIHVNEPSQELSTEASGFNNVLSNSSYEQSERNDVAFPFIPANNDSNNTNGSNPDMYINANVNNTNFNNTKIENLNIPTKQEFESNSPFQFNEKETSEIIFPQSNSEVKIEQTSIPPSTTNTTSTTATVIPPTTNTTNKTEAVTATPATITTTTTETTSPKKNVTLETTGTKTITETTKEITNFENKNDENTNKNNINTDIKTSPVKNVTEPDLFKNKQVAATVLFTKEATD